jgi:outer membrane protein assembly factor BamB
MTVAGEGIGETLRAWRTIGAVSRLISIWRAWSLGQRAALIAGIVAVAAGIGVAAYLHFKRPGDISNPAVTFVKHHKQPKKVAKTVNWPVYGYDEQRTRYLPADNVKPPFHELWHFGSKQLLEFSPILVGHRLYYIDKSADFYAVSANTGKRVWKTDLGTLNASSPAYSDGRLFGVSLDPGQVFAINPKQGKVIWKRALPGRSETSPVVDGKEVVVGSESGDVYGLSTKTGSIDWSVHTAGPVKGGVAIDKGTAFFGNYAGQFYAVDIKTGNVKWQAQSEGLSFGRAGSFYSTPAVAFGRVYAGNKDSRVYSFSEDTGAVAWTHSTGGEIYPAPAVADVPGAPPAVYIGSLDHHFYALDAKTGNVLWSVDTGGPILGAASVVGRTVYVSVIGPNIGTFGYDAKTGKKDFYDPLGEYNPVISDGQRIYLTGGGAIKALVPRSGGKGSLNGAKKRARAKAAQQKKKHHAHGGSGAKGNHKGSGSPAKHN